MPSRHMAWRRISRRSADVFQQAGYYVGAIVVNASLFVPQSRPRLFGIGVHESAYLPEGLTADGPMARLHTRTVHTAYVEASPKTGTRLAMVDSCDPTTAQGQLTLK